MQLGKTSILRFMNLEATVLLIHLLFLVYIILSSFLFGVCFIKVLMFALCVQFNFGHKQIPLTLTEIASKLIVALYLLYLILNAFLKATIATEFMLSLITKNDTVADSIILSCKLPYLSSFL